MTKYLIDGTQIIDSSSLCDEFARAVNAPNGYFGKDLQSFDDCLFGGYGLETPCEIVWQASAVTRGHLGSAALLSHCQKLLDESAELETASFKEGKDWVVSSIEKARAGELTLFDVFVDSIRSVEERSQGKRKIVLRLE